MQMYSGAKTALKFAVSVVSLKLEGAQMWLLGSSRLCPNVLTGELLTRFL
jgi:hypothetical protein